MTGSASLVAAARPNEVVHPTLAFDQAREDRRRQRRVVQRFRQVPESVIGCLPAALIVIAGVTLAELGKRVLRQNF